MISKVINETDQVMAGNEVGEGIFFRKYIKENLRKFEPVELLLVDLTSLADTDEEILTAIESLMIMDYQLRIILLAPTRKEGNSLLRECFYMGIYDIINTDEYLKIHDELTNCIISGMKYKDALRFRVTLEEDEAVTENKAIKKIMIGLSGAGSRMGCTHTSIMLANMLRQKNFMVALVEMNPSGTYQKICENKKEKLFEDGYFTIQGVDFYPDCDKSKLQTIAGRLYNFILLDFGNYYQMDQILFNKCDIRIIFSGSKPWETEMLQGIFKEQDEVVLQNYHFCFQFAASNRRLQEEIQLSMEPLQNIYFPEYIENPFEIEINHFPEGNLILKGYIPQEIANVKEGKKKKLERGISWMKKRI